mgnify:CR=1 FL=1
MKSLEGSDLFPIIAWGSILLFTLLTFILVLQLQATVRNLELQTERNLTAIKNT